MEGIEEVSNLEWQSCVEDDNASMGAESWDGGYNEGHFEGLPAAVNEGIKAILNFFAPHF